MKNYRDKKKERTSRENEKKRERWKKKYLTREKYGTNSSSFNDETYHHVFSQAMFIF